MQQYAVFGNPVEHSKSPEIHTRFAAQTQQQMEYKKQRVNIEQFEKTVEQFFLAEGKGLNITVPFKLKAYAVAKHLSQRAKRAGAVNTLYIKDGELFGDNTDGAGLCRDLLQNLGWAIQGRSILVLGAGGAVRGVLEPLLEQNPKLLHIANRTENKAKSLVGLFDELAAAASCELSASSYEHLATIKQPYDLVINGTSMSLAGDVPDIPGELINHSQCYDMMYASKPTVFLQWAVKQGAQSIADGLGMLVEQAAESFYLWRNVRPQTSSVIESMRSSL